MQKPNGQDLLRADGWLIGTAGLLFSMAINAKHSSAASNTDGYWDHDCVGRRSQCGRLGDCTSKPKKACTRKSAKMPSPEDVQKFQWQASNALNAIIFRKAVITGLVLADLIVLAIFWR